LLVAYRSTESDFCEENRRWFSACFRALFRQWFLVDRIHETPTMLDLAIPVHRHAAFYFKLGSLLADGEACRSLWAAKGGGWQRAVLVVQERGFV
jgi:hypothetical protein